MEPTLLRVCSIPLVLKRELISFSHVSAMVSSFMDRPVYRDMVVLGEVGLAGEIRGVSRPGLRIKEAEKMGFSRFLLSSGHKGSVTAPAGMQLVFLDSIRDLVEALF